MPLRSSSVVCRRRAIFFVREIRKRSTWGASCPLTDLTRGLVDQAALARPPTGAHLINVGRGGAAVETDLILARWLKGMPMRGLASTLVSTP